MYVFVSVALDGFKLVLGIFLDYTHEEIFGYLSTKRQIYMTSMELQNPPSKRLGNMSMSKLSRWIGGQGDRSYAKITNIKQCLTLI